MKNPVLVPHRTQNRNEFDLGLPCQLRQFILDGIQGIFIAFEQDQPGWLNGDDLSTQFRANGTPGSGDHNHFSTDIAFQ